MGSQEQQVLLKTINMLIHIVLKITVHPSTQQSILHIELPTPKMLPVNLERVEINALSVDAKNFSSDNKIQHFDFNGS